MTCRPLMLTHMELPSRPVPDASEHTARIHVPPSTDQTPPARPAAAQVCEKTVLVREAASERTRPATPVAGSPTFDDLFQCYAILGKIGDGEIGRASSRERVSSPV